MGQFCRLGGKTLDQEGYDLLGLICGSEGLLGVITEVTVKILKKPQTVKAALIGFSTIERWRKLCFRDNFYWHCSIGYGNNG